jgi:ParB-like chromosome segregation protein Spo0J
MIDSIADNVHSFENTNNELMVAIKDLLLSGTFTYEQAEKKLHISRSRIDKILGIVTLPQVIQDKLKSKELTFSAAEALVKVNKSRTLDTKQKEDLYQKAIGGMKTDDLKTVIQSAIDTTEAIKKATGKTGEVVGYIHREVYSRERMDETHDLILSIVRQKEVDEEELTSDEQECLRIVKYVYQFTDDDVTKGKIAWETKHPAPVKTEGETAIA